MSRYESRSPQETEEIGYEIGSQLRAGDCVAFTGGLGAGKTCFVRGIAKALAVRDDVSSPTFAIVNQYRGAVPLYHFDMYRITSLDDLYATGFFDYLDQPGIFLIEWSENIKEALPPQTIWISIEVLGETKRKITVKGDQRFETDHPGA